MESQFAIKRTIEDIKNDDLKLQITGYIKEIHYEASSFILDDKTGQIKINFDDLDFPFKENDLINVIGELRMKTSGEKTIEASIIQDMNKLNFKYYKKLYSLKKELL